MLAESGGIFNKLRTVLIRGVLFVVPIWLTVFVFGIVYGLCESWFGAVTAQLVRWLLPAVWLSGSWSDGHIPGLSMVTATVVMALIGFVASWHCGRQGLRVIDYLFLSIPGANTIYSAARKIIDALGEPGKSRFQKVVYINWPGPGLKTLGFVTNEVVQAGSGKKKYYVFVPTMPNPTSGFVVLVDAEETIETDLSPEEGLRLCMSLGVVSPNESP